MMLIIIKKTWMLHPMASRFTLILLLLPFAIACGSAARPLPVASSTPTSTAATVFSGGAGGSGTRPVYEGIVS